MRTSTLTSYSKSNSRWIYYLIEKGEVTWKELGFTQSQLNERLRNVKIREAQDKFNSL